MDTKRFPEVYSFKVLEQNSFMIMEKLDKTLNALYIEQNRTFSLKTLALIANELMVSLMELHKHGYLHRDIKPENIMTAERSHAVKLIDFGLAER
jgi:serine/threonine protein kinase